MVKEQNLGLSPVILIPKWEGINQHCSYLQIQNIFVIFRFLIVRISGASFTHFYLLKDTAIIMSKMNEFQSPSALPQYKLPQKEKSSQTPCQKPTSYHSRIPGQRKISLGNSYNLQSISYV